MVDQIILDFSLDKDVDPELVFVRVLLQPLVVALVISLNGFEKQENRQRGLSPQLKSSNPKFFSCNELA